METGASAIPANENIKLLFRHSIRSSSAKSNDPNELTLTREGLMMAQYFGRNIEYSIGKVYCSHFRRCVQTVELMQMGRCEEWVINSDDRLSSNLICPNEEGQSSFFELGLKKVFCMLANGISLRGFNSADACVSSIVDLVFSTGNENNTLDLYCTHDIHLMLVIARLFRIEKLEEIRDNWPYMLEGIYLWGCREDFYVTWRGQTKRFTRFLLDSQRPEANDSKSN